MQVEVEVDLKVQECSLQIFAMYASRAFKPYAFFEKKIFCYFVSRKMLLPSFQSPEMPNLDGSAKWQR